MSPNRAFVERQIWRDRLVPIRLPLESTHAERLIGIAADEAWAPLAIALTDILRDLWSLTVGPSAYSGRVPGDEYLYQVLKVSLTSMCAVQFDGSDRPALPLDALPDSLPSPTTLASLQYEERQAIPDHFDQLEAALIREAVLHDVPVDTRTVWDVVAPFRQFFEALELTRIKEALAEDQIGWEQAESLRAIVKERERLLRFNDVGDLAIALAVLARIEELWELLFEATDDLARYPGDEDVYQAYRNLLLDCLDTPAYHHVHELAAASLPALLPSEDAMESDPWLTDEVPPRLRTLHYECIALANRLHKSTLFDGVEVVKLAERFPREEQGWKTFQSAVNRLRASSASTSNAEPRRRGRKKKDVPFEVANRVWWDLSDKLAPKKPSQQDVCDGLAEIGIHMSLRKFGEISSKWNEDGITFPGPRPENDAETA